MSIYPLPPPDAPVSVPGQLRFSNVRISWDDANPYTGLRISLTIDTGSAGATEVNTGLPYFNKIANHQILDMSLEEIRVVLNQAVPASMSQPEADQHFSNIVGMVIAIYTFSHTSLSGLHQAGRFQWPQYFSY